MQTFLPHPNFAVSAMCLDWRRLGKQRVEAGQIITALQKGGGWSNHPATKMWDGHIEALMLYRDTCIREWVRRGYRNTMPELIPPNFVGEIDMPSWLGREDVHSSHRAALLSKDENWYSQWNWEEDPVYDYVWPTP